MSRVSPVLIPLSTHNDNEHLRLLAFKLPLTPIPLHCSHRFRVIASLPHSISRTIFNPQSSDRSPHRRTQSPPACTHTSSYDMLLHVHTCTYLYSICRFQSSFRHFCFRTSLEFDVCLSLSLSLPLFLLVHLLRFISYCLLSLSWDMGEWSPVWVESKSAGTPLLPSALKLTGVRG